MTRFADSAGFAMGLDEMDGLCRMVKELLACDAVAILLWGGNAPEVGVADLSRNDAIRLAQQFAPNKNTMGSRTRTDPFDPFDDDGETMSGWSLHAVLTRVGFASATRAALVRDGQVVGLLCAFTKSDGRVDTALVSALARCCEFALEYRGPVESLSKIDSLVLHADSFITLIPALTTAITALLGEISVGLSVFDAEVGLLKTMNGSFALPPEITKCYSIDPNDLHSNAARVFELQRPFASNRVIGDPAILQNYPIAFGIENMIALPLVISGNSTGVLMIANKDGGFQPSDVEHAAELVPQISVAVELARINEARRFTSNAEQVLAEISHMSADPVLDPDSFRPSLSRAAELIYADELRLTNGAGTVLSVAPDRVVLPDPSVKAYSLEFPGGRAWTDPLRLVATRTLGGVFSPTEHQFLSGVARALTEVKMRSRAQRQEAELMQHRERQRIADDLHDDVSQLLFAAQLELDKGAQEENLAGRATRAASELIRRAEGALRDAIFVLQQPEVAASAALVDVVELIRTEWALEVTSAIDPTIDRRVSPEVCTEITRAARECLMNVVKHAGPCTAFLSARLVDGFAIEIAITDTGFGLRGTEFEPGGANAHGYGLSALRRRVSALGGSVTVRGQAGVGTTVTIRIPIPNQIEAR